LNNKRQSIGPKPDSRPRLEGARCKYDDKLLTHTQPFSHAHTHIINQTPPLLGQRSGPVIKRPRRMGPEYRLDPCSKEQQVTQTAHYKCSSLACRGL